MIGQLPPLLAVGQLQLPVQGSRVHPDAHAAQLHSPAQQLAPNQNISVEIPVVVVRSPAVVLLSRFQSAADALDEDRAIFPEAGVLPLLGGLVRPAVLQLLGGDKAHLPVELAQGLELGVDGLHGVLGVADGPDDVPHRGVEIIQVPLFGADDLFPVPLVHVDAVEVVQLVLVPADGVHVRIQALAGVKIIALQGQALPFGQALHHLRPGAGAEDVEGNGAFHPVEVVVEAGILRHKEGGGDPVEIQQGSQPVLKEALEQGNGFLRLVNGKEALIARGDIGFHSVHLRFIE